MGAEFFSVSLVNSFINLDSKVKKKGWKTNSYPVDCYKLDDLVEKYHPDNGVVDYLSIDVEGYEREVVDSIDFKARDYGVVQVETNVQSIQQANDDKAMEDVRAIRDRFRLLGYIPRAFEAGVDDFFIHPEIVKAAMTKRTRQRQKLERGRRRRNGRYRGSRQGYLNAHDNPVRSSQRRRHSQRNRGYRHQNRYGGRQGGGNYR